MRSAALLLALPIGVALCAAATPAQELRDPTRPPRVTTHSVGSSDQPARFALEAVWITPKRRIARIDGRELEEGDAFRGAEVARIEAAGVTLLQNGEPRLLTFTETVLQPAEGPR